MLASNPNFDLSPLLSIAPNFTSFGDYTRLNILEPFRPSSGNTTLVVEDIDVFVRFLFPSLSCAFMEYDGLLRIGFESGMRFTTEDKMQDFANALRGWIDAIFQ